MVSAHKSNSGDFITYGHFRFILIAQLLQLGILLVLRQVVLVRHGLLPTSLLACPMRQTVLRSEVWIMMEAGYGQLLLFRGMVSMRLLQWQLQRSITQ